LSAPFYSVIAATENTLKEAFVPEARLASPDASDKFLDTYGQRQNPEKPNPSSRNG
jgi:heat shock protein HspQ